jgi:hypothetical protein
VRLHSFLFAVFGIAAQLRFTKVLCDNNDATMLCHSKIGGTRKDAGREVTKREAAGSSPFPWPIQNYIRDIQEPQVDESQLFSRM